MQWILMASLPPESRAFGLVSTARLIGNCEYDDTEGYNVYSCLADAP